MKKLILVIVILTIVVSLLACGNDETKNNLNNDKKKDDNTNDNTDDKNEEAIKEFMFSDRLNKGIVMLTPSGGRGFERFYDTFKDKLIVDHAFFPFGWGSVENVDGVYNWSEVDELVEKTKEQDKKFAIAFWSAAHSFQQIPDYLSYDYNVRRIISVGSFVNFENELNYRDFKVGENGEVISGDKVISQNKSLNGFGNDFLIYPGNKINKNYDASIGFDYKSLTDGNIILKAIYSNGDVKILSELNLQKNQKGSKMLRVLKEDLVNISTVTWSFSGDSVLVDNVAISYEIPGEQGSAIAYPNYFDPQFKVYYERFLRAFYERYKDNETVVGVYVGGYGRWDEVTLGGDFLNPTEDNQMIKELWRI